MHHRPSKHETSGYGPSGHVARGGWGSGPTERAPRRPAAAPDVDLGNLEDVVLPESLQTRQPLARQNLATAQRAFVQTFAYRSLWTVNELLDDVREVPGAAGALFLGGFLGSAPEGWGLWAKTSSFFGTMTRASWPERSVTIETFSRSHFDFLIHLKSSEPERESLGTAASVCS